MVVAHIMNFTNMIKTKPYAKHFLFTLCSPKTFFTIRKVLVMMEREVVYWDLQENGWAALAGCFVWRKFSRLRH